MPNRLPIGVFIPQPEIGNNPAGIRRFAVELEALGCAHLLAYDHVVHRAGRAGVGNHEPLTLLAYLAAVTGRMRLMTAVVILPQRQTVLFAKQAATVDLLSSGRLTVGVGIGWNALEFEALNEPFSGRAQRFEEQLALLRALWTDATVEFSGSQHTMHDAGLRPMPQQRPIPLWIGANAEPAVRRAGRLADGLFVNFPAGPRAERSLATVRDALADAGRDPTTFGINGSIALEGSDPAAWRHEYAWWRTRGATQVTLSPPDGLTGVDAILERLRAGFEALRYTPDE